MLAQVVGFARLLRHAGMATGTSRVTAAAQALACVGLARRLDVYWSLAATFVSRREELVVFDEAFNSWWNGAVAQTSTTADPTSSLPTDEDSATGSGERQVRLRADGDGDTAPSGDTARKACFEASLMERLGAKDFATMSEEELAEVRKALALFKLVLPEVPARRTVPAARGPQPDLRRTLREAARSGGEIVHWMHRTTRRRQPPLVLLCDISGSMGRYTRVLLQFAHALANDHHALYAFVFGTRLTNITRALRRRDVDAALERVGRAALDWAGGTRIAAALESFNRLWSRRVLSAGAVVLLITDGLEREDGATLAAQTQRLQRSCRRLVWLNPLLSYASFEPRAAGVRAMLPHVDDFLPVHNLDSLAAIGLAFQSHGFQQPRPWRRQSPWK